MSCLKRTIDSFGSTFTYRTKVFVGVLVLFVLCCLYQSSNDFVKKYQNEIFYGVGYHDKMSSATAYPDHSLRILCFGGSTTWGADLESRLESYPYQVVPSEPSISMEYNNDPEGRMQQKDTMVLNLAQQATGADYSSKCIQSMIRDGLRNYDSRIDVDDHQILHSLTFDVILIEYSINGMEDMDILIKRLHEAYPNAFFIYIHLWSPRMTIQNKVTGERPRDIMNEPGLTFKEREQKLIPLLKDSNAVWIWDEVGLQESFRKKALAYDYMKEVGGVVWSFPLHGDPSGMLSLFSNNLSHLNENGHNFVASEVRRILLDHKVMTDQGMVYGDRRISQPDGSWGRGDQCHSWFETGMSSLVHTGGRIRQFVKPSKYAQEIFQDGGESTIIFDNKAPWVMPLSVQHMAWGEHGHYPKTKVTLTSDLKFADRIGHDSTKTMILDPVNSHAAITTWHGTLTTFVGVVPPGQSTLTFECLEEAAKPLRLTSIVMCGECE